MLSNDGFTEKSNCTAMHSAPFLRNYHSNFLRKFKGKRIFDHQFVIEWRIPQPLYWSTMEMACNESKTSTGPWSHHFSCRTFGVSLICVHSNTGTQTPRDTHTNKQRLTHTLTHTHTHTHTHIYIYRQTHTQTQTGSHTTHTTQRQTHTHTHTDIYRHTHGMPTHTHTHIHTQFSPP